MQNQFNDVSCKIISVHSVRCKSKILATPILAKSHHWITTIEGGHKCH